MMKLKYSTHRLIEQGLTSLFNSQTNASVINYKTVLYNTSS